MTQKLTLTLLLAASQTACQLTLCGRLTTSGTGTAVGLSGEGRHFRGSGKSSLFGPSKASPPLPVSLASWVFKPPQEESAAVGEIQHTARRCREDQRERLLHLPFALLAIGGGRWGGGPAGSLFPPAPASGEQARIHSSGGASRGLDLLQAGQCWRRGPKKGFLGDQVGLDSRPPSLAPPLCLLMEPAPC